MAGSAVASAPVLHRKRGVVRISAALTADASGVVSGAVNQAAFGRLVGVIVKALTGGFLPAISIKDAKTGAAVATYDVGAANKFSGTTTGDTTGGTSEDLWTTNGAHGLSEGDGIVFLSLTGNGAGGPTVGTEYFVVTTTGFAATTFCLSDTAAHALAGTNIVNVGATDASAATWYKVGQTPDAAFFRPTTNVADVAGAAISAADTAPNVNRDIKLGGKVEIAATGLGNAGTCRVVLIVDEANLADGPAITV
jgi:hypothetical protein